MTGTERLTRRERATLEAVERRLGNAEIAQEFHVSVRTVESHIASLRRKLDVDSRSALITAARERRSSSIVVPSTSFIGRDADVAAVRDLLERHRWVTVVGPAGAGKTRLSLELAAADGRAPIVVELEHAAGPAVLPAVAKAVGVGSDGAGALVSACVVALGTQRRLLVLDNCDRVLDDVCELVDALLGSAPGLSILATSRSPVGGAGESIYALQPLSVESPSGARALFADRAGSAVPSYAPDATDQEAITRICRRLDGLPLAIELAAARLRHLSLAELETLLEAGFTALDRARPVSRHRTLETAFAWTWDLLDEDERAMLGRLAAVPRSFDLALAEAVSPVGSSGIVLRLLDRSLISPVSRSADPRKFRLLDSLREYVLERTDPEVVAEVKRLHAERYATLASMLTGRARVDDSREAADLAYSNCVDVNAAANWALEHHPGLALSLVTSLSIGAEHYNPDVDSLTTIALAAADPAVLALARPTDLFHIGLAMCYWDLELVHELAQLALAKVTDPSSELSAHHLAGYAEAYRHCPTQAMTHLLLAERLAIELDDAWELASVRQAIGIALRDAEPDAAIAAFESSIQSYATAGDRMHVNNARYMMASTAASAGIRTDEAMAWAEECAAYARESGSHHELAHAMLTRTMLMPVSAASTPDLLEAIAEFRTVGDLRCLTRALLLLAERTPVNERVAVLRQAYDVAQQAHDVTHRERAAGALITALWDVGAKRGAVVELGVLTGLIGEEAARARCPAAMLSELDRWDTTIAEGMSRGQT